jgi:hypothetical protein
MAGDALYNNVSLLLHADGADGSTTFTDNSPTPKAMTRNGVAEVSTTQSKFGGSSAKFSAGGSVTALTSAAFGFGTGDFTVEAFVYMTGNAVSGGNTICDFRTTAGASPWTFFVGNTGAGNKLQTYLSTSPDVNAGTNYLSLNTWYHIAIARASDVWKIFIDGAEVGTATNSGNLGSSNVLTIGNVAGATNTTGCFPGYIDDLRITKGVARYTGNFTPPAAAFDDRSPQVSGNIKDSSGANAARTVRAYRRDTGALVGSTTSNGTTGNYTIDCTTDVEVTVIAFDNATSGTYYNDQAARVIPA